MGRVVDLERERSRRLSDVIERQLRSCGGRTLGVDLDAVDDLGRWRRAAVAAAHRMGHRASTYVWRGQVCVALDLPVTDAERRQAALVISSVLGLPRR